MVNKLIKCYLSVVPLDDRDSYINKRFETPGYLLGNLTYQCIHKITKDINRNLNKYGSNSKKISDTLNYILNRSK